MSAAITVVHQAELVEREPEGIRFTADERSMIREAYARGADESTFRALVAIAEARGLDPRKGMVHFVDRGGRWSVQPSIDYFRSAADATGLYDGQDQPEFEHEGGRLVSATVRVWRKGWSRPMVGYARFSEFDRSPHRRRIDWWRSTRSRTSSGRRSRAVGLGVDADMACFSDDPRNRRARVDSPLRAGYPARIVYLVSGAEPQRRMGRWRLYTKYRATTDECGAGNRSRAGALTETRSTGPRLRRTTQSSHSSTAAQTGTDSGSSRSKRAMAATKQAAPWVT